MTAKQRERLAVDELKSDIRVHLDEIEQTFLRCSSVLLATHAGDPLVWSTTADRERPPPPKRKPFPDDDKIPEHLRRQDDEATKGDMDTIELLVSIAAMRRLSRRFAPEAFFSRRRRVPPLDPERSPLFRVVGEHTVFSCYSVGHYYYLAFYCDPTVVDSSVAAKQAHDRLMHIIAALRGLLYRRATDDAPHNEQPRSSDDENANRERPVTSSDDDVADSLPAADASLDDFLGDARRDDDEPRRDDVAEDSERHPDVQDGAAARDDADDSETRPATRPERADGDESTAHEGGQETTPPAHNAEILSPLATERAPHDVGDESATVLDGAVARTPQGRGEGDESQATHVTTSGADDEDSTRPKSPSQVRDGDVPVTPPRATDLVVRGGDEASTPPRVTGGDESTVQSPLADGDESAATSAELTPLVPPAAKEMDAKGGDYDALASEEL